MLRLKGWYSRDSLCCGVGARMMYITAKMQNESIFYLAMMASHPTTSTQEGTW